MNSKFIKMTDVAIRDFYAHIERNLEKLFPTQHSLAEAYFAGLEIHYPPVSIDLDSMKMVLRAEMSYPDEIGPNNTKG